MDRHRTEPTGTERAGKIVPVVSIACFIVPGLVWAGWHFDVAVLKSVIPGLTAMNPVTALCFLLCGISLWMLMKPISSRKVRLIASVLVLAVFLVAAQRLAAYIFDWGWSVDRLFFRAKLDLSRIPNRMAPNTAALFLLVSVSLLAINSCRRKAIVVAQVLGALIGLTGIFALVGYLFDAMVAAQMKGFNAMAIPTASLMVLLGAAVALIRPNQGPVTVFTNERLAGKVARSLLAFSVIGPLVLGYLRLQGQWRDYYATEFGTALYATSMVAMFGFVIWLTARSVDRSDVRRAEAVEATDNEREFTRQVVDAVPSFIFVKDRAGKFKFANRAVAEAYGTSPDRLLGKTDADFSSNSEEIEAFRARDLQVIESQRELTYTEPMTDASGQIRWLYTIKRPITHPNGELTDGVLGISLDVTDRNRLMDALQGSEERTNSILSSIDEVIFSTSADRSELLFINEAAARMFGHPIDDLMRDRQLIREKFLPEDALIEQEGMELAAAGHAADFEFRIVGTDGEIRWLNTRARRVDAEDGTPLRIDGTTRDVTEQKRFQEELSRAKDEADRANSAKSEFLSRMSHELRTPLNSILGFAQLLEMDEPTQKQFEAVNYILSAGRHLLALVNDVLDIARVETGNLAISLEPVDVAVAIREAVALAEPVARGRSVQLTADFDGLEGMHIMADRHRFAQVLLNLLSNAVKYNTEGGSVSISTYPGGEGRIQIEVADTGPGIPIEMMDRLFRPF